MIYLITGTPGTGKTSFAVSMILNNTDGLFYTDQDGQKIPRPLYFCHIDGLDEKRFKAHRLTEEELQSAPLKEIVPQGAVIIVDEADYTYPVRSSGKAVPPYIQTLKELRHEGFTLILMTQHPSMIDIYVRQLVGKHFHLERKAVGSKCYEFYKCVTELNNPASVSGVTARWYKPDPKTFKYYKSASKHIKFTKKTPLVVWVLLGLILFIAIKGYGVFTKHSGKSEIQAAQNQPKLLEQQSSVKQQGHFSNFGTANSQNVVLTVETLTPTLENHEESAPIYDGVRKVVDFPQIKGCVLMERAERTYSCTCYTQQGSVSPVTISYCQAYLQRRPFNPYQLPNNPVMGDNRQQVTFNQTANP